jgi:hypothetical protein
MRHHSSIDRSARRQRIYDFLKSQHVAVLSTITPDNNPHGVVVYYAVDEDLVMHIMTKTGTRKYDNMVHNDHVMLTVFEPETQTTAQFTGLAAERGGSNNINKVAGSIFGSAVQTSSSGLPPIVKLQAGAFTTFRITPIQIRMAVYARPDPGGYDTLFETLDSYELNREN